MRRLPIWGFILLVLVYIVLVQFIPRLTKEEGGEYATFQTVSEVISGLWVTVGVGSAVALIAVAVLRWWRPVFIEDAKQRLRGWVWVFPIIIIAAIVGGTAYGKLADQGGTYILAMLLGAVFIGVSEEVMFRGVGVTAFRRAGFTEGWVALWTSVIFGLVHATNLFSEGIAALPQVLVTACAGYFFYLARRVSGGLWLPILLHGLWDFGSMSNLLGESTSIGAGAFLVADAVMLIIAVFTIRKIFPRLEKSADAEASTRA